MSPPLAEILATAVFNELIDINLFRGHGLRVIGGSIFQFKVTIIIYFEPQLVSIDIGYVFAFVVNGVFEHRDGSRINGCFCPAGFTDHHFHFGDGRYHHIQFLQYLTVYFYAGVRHGCGHQEK